MKKKRRKTKKKSTVGGGEEELGGILSGAVEEDEDLVAVVGELDLGVVCIFKKRGMCFNVGIKVPVASRSENSMW